MTSVLEPNGMKTEHHLGAAFQRLKVAADKNDTPFSSTSLHGVMCFLLTNQRFFEQEQSKTDKIELVTLPTV